jgi:hypothetical protein
MLQKVGGILMTLTGSIDLTTSRIFKLWQLSLPEPAELASEQHCGHIE